MEATINMSEMYGKGLACNSSGSQEKVYEGIRLMEQFINTIKDEYSDESEEDEE